MNISLRFRRFQRCSWLFLPTLILAFLCACSSSNPEAPTLVNGEHVAGWDKEHGAAFLKNNLQCHQCHGEDLQDGGLLKTSGPTCFSNVYGTTICHGALSGPWHNRSRNPIFFSNHGEFSTKFPALTEGGPQGFKLCAACHGVAFNGGPFPGQQQGTVTPTASCVGCHESIFPFIGKSAPHPDAASWDLQHTVTSIENAASCAECHRNRGDFRLEVWGGLPFQYDANAAPGCLNNTLCHGEDLNPHAAQSNWATTGLHGVQAKQSPQRGKLYGFSNCALCHGPQLSDCTASCHIPPHPANWTAVAAGVVTHVSTTEENVATCAMCHAVGVPGTPGCYNNTLCHGTRTPHDSLWAQSINHGVSAKLPASTVAVDNVDRFVNCQICHGPYFDANKCGTCHLPPHPVDWMGPKPDRPDLGLDSPTHTSYTDYAGNVCFNCHAAGSVNNSLNPLIPAVNGAEPGCFNNTLCHGDENQYVPANHNYPDTWVWSFPENHGVSAKAAPSTTDSGQSLLRCIVCHGADLTIGCTGYCHNPPHPDAWIGNGSTFTHQNTQVANAVVCAQCHAGGRTPAVPITLPPGSAVGCFNNSLCH